jgi:hypothetical protein
MDIKPAPDNSLEYYLVWKNNFKSKLVSSIGRKIKVKYE